MKTGSRKRRPTGLPLFADELFRWDLSFRVRDVEQAEPSDWEIASRYIGWTFCILMALLIFIKGLGVI